MGKATPVVFDRFTFESKEAAEAECRRRIAAYSPGEVVSGESLTFFTSLIMERHHNPHGKIGPGIARMYVTKNRYGHAGLRIIRADSSDVDVSWRRCIRPKGDWTLYSETARAIVEPQIAEFRRISFAFGLAPCQSCQVMLRPTEGPRYEVDHVSPGTFEHLLERFCEIQGPDWDWSSIELIDSLDGGRVSFRDPELTAAWSAFHEKHAVLRILCQPCHHRLPKRIKTTAPRED